MDKPQLLIVEDDLDLAEMVTSYFRVQNYDVLSAAWADEALKLAQDNDLDLIMLDIRLPDIDGFELCRQLRQNRKTQDTPIIFLTEKRDRIDKLHGLQLGVVDYITKPFDITELRLRVRNAIQRAKTPSATHPVTELMTGSVVDEKMAVLLASERAWAALLVAITRLDDFRERYGFVAADDVLRALALIIRNAVRQYGDKDDFIGHAAPDQFLILTDAAHVDDIRERIERRIGQSQEYFYPLHDRDRAQQAAREQHLNIETGQVSASDGPYTDADALLTALRSRLHVSLSSSPAPDDDVTRSVRPAWLRRDPDRNATQPPSEPSSSPPDDDVTRPHRGDS